MADELLENADLAELNRLLQRLQMLQSEPLWTVNDVAEFLRISPRHLRERIMAIDSEFPRPIHLPAEKGQGAQRWQPAQIRQWLASTARKSGAGFPCR